MEKQLKTWVTPQLTVLARSNPEEAVLEICKMSITDTGPGFSFTFCNKAYNDPCFEASQS